MKPNLGLISEGQHEAIACWLLLFNRQLIYIAMNQKEVWKPAKNYEGLYQVSSLGRIRSLDRTKTSNWGQIVSIKGIVRKLNLDSSGYPSLCLCKNGKQKTFAVHVLMDKTFDIQGDGYQINHIDGNKQNNNILNLERCTVKENINHAFRTGLHKGSMFGRFGDKNPKSKGVVQLSLSGEYVNDFGSIMEAQRATGLNNSHISGNCRGKNSHCGGFLWMYKKDYYELENN